jgi:nitric-oxide synthase
MAKLSLRWQRAEAPQGNPLERRLRRISAMERREEARAFLDAFHDATGAGKAARQARWSEVRRGLSRHGHYDHTPEELAFGARLAWRNNGRCIGRLLWESLDVVDCRHVTEVEAIAGRVFSHLGEAQGDGRIRSMISIFAQVRGGELPAWIESGQAIQYAAYLGPDGQVIGDRQNLEATRIATSLGWQPPAVPEEFHRLPLLLRDRKDRRHQFDLPAQLAPDLPILHPDHPGFAELGLRWYPIPLVTGHIMTIGGIDYPCAPFNGFYMATEIASRDFADRKRYDALPRVAKTLGLAADDRIDPFWKDRALTELNAAVLHSFQSAGLTIVDHHSASNQFMTFHRREQAAGRCVAADWRWIVPPQSGSACEVFHLRMRNFHPVPNFYRDRGEDGLRMMPWYGDRHRRSPEIWLDRVTRRWKLWKRMAW